MRFTTLIDAGELAARLSSPSLVMADCRFDLKDPASGERAYAAAHIPGAVYVHLDRDLAGTKTGSNGRHPLPGPVTLAATFGRLGIDRASQVVAYDEHSGAYASRLWWMLRWLGHDAVAVLNGGLARWTADGHPTRDGVETARPRHFEPRVRAEMLAEATDVVAHSGPGWRLIDARAPERFRGDVEPLDRVAGHIPGAINHFYGTNTREDGTFETPSTLAARFTDQLGGVPPDRVISYCGSGVTACHNVLAMEHAGLTGSKLYVGSWSEWSSDPARPIERSPSTADSGQS